MSAARPPGSAWHSGVGGEATAVREAGTHLRRRNTDLPARGGAMEIDWLADFVVLAETRSFPESARRRHITQETLSRRIRNLELWMGTPLVQRNREHTALTPAGAFFHRRADDVLYLLEQARLAIGRERNEGRAN